MPKGTAVDTTAQTKWCPMCKQNLPWGEFYKSKATVHGYSNRCKKCSYTLHNMWRLKNLDKMSADRKARYAKASERYKDYSRKQHYGLLPGQYADLLEAQGGRCAICATDRPGGKGGFHVDHCHASNKIRGLLCHSCNLALGHFKHSEVILYKAVLYLTGEGE